MGYDEKTKETIEMRIRAFGRKRNPYNYKRKTLNISSVGLLHYSYYSVDELMENLLTRYIEVGHTTTVDLKALSESSQLMELYCCSFSDCCPDEMNYDYDVPEVMDQADEDMVYLRREGFSIENYHLDPLGPGDEYESLQYNWKLRHDKALYASGNDLFGEILEPLSVCTSKAVLRGVVQTKNPCELEFADKDCWKY